MTEFFIPRFYIPPLYVPLYWRNETSGVLPAAVEAYLNACLYLSPITDEQLKLVADYCDYYINAPCWAENVQPDGEMRDELNRLIAGAKTLESVEHIQRWIRQCLDLGLDPW
ncbi:MAG: hypothetical protein JWQ04_2768 [Pedosphaera sp.]|nr:hypothetical protein [Pedosphaera sp.]